MEKSETPFAPGLMLICRPGFESALLRELEHRLENFRPEEAATGSGWVLPGPPSPGSLPPGALRPLETPLIFERQRLPGAQWFPLDASLPERVAGYLAQGLTPPSNPWSLHVFTPDPQTHPGLTARAGRLERAARAALLAGNPGLDELHRAPDAPPARGARIAQVCLVPEGGWASVAAAQALSSPAPGGVHRMPGDPGAPSRSYLKLEEAFQVLGRQPAPRERVIDLGAAPGGWSYACLKRGCTVLAVDNGPMKIRGMEDLPGRLEHKRANGLTYRPTAGPPADWMISDMLVAPGETLGLLRRWLEGGWMRRFVVNVKLPQRNPVDVLAPMETFLLQWPGLRFRMTQLYHDRREITVVGELTGKTLAAPARAAGQTEKGRKKPDDAPARRGPAHRDSVKRKPTQRKPARRSAAPSQPKRRKRR